MVCRGNGRMKHEAATWLDVLALSLRSEARCVWLIVARLPALAPFPGFSPVPLPFLNLNPAQANGFAFFHFGGLFH